MERRRALIFAAAVSCFALGGPSGALAQNTRPRLASCGVLEAKAALGRPDEHLYATMCLPLIPPAAPPTFCANLFSNPNLTADEVIIVPAACKNFGQAATPQFVAGTGNIDLGGLLPKTRNAFQALLATEASSSEGGLNRGTILGTSGAIANLLAVSNANETNESNANVKAAISAHDARIAATQRKYCKYKVNTTSLFSGVLSLARAVKIKDNATLFTLLAPLPFSVCDSAATQISPIAPLADTSIAVGQTIVVRVLEEGYDLRQGFSLTPDNATFAVSTPHHDQNQHTVGNEFDILGRAVGTTNIQIHDVWGQSQQFKLTVSG